MMNLKNNTPLPFPRSIAIMGSTGSIGCQTLDVVARYPDKFKITALTAGRNWKLLADQACRFRPKMVAIAEESCLLPLKEALSDINVTVAAGKEALIEASTMEEAEIVVGALVGYSGLPSTIAALEAGKYVALANKETLVVAGEIINKIINHKGKRILPVDSEHSAIFQCLRGEKGNSISRLILTASGGPFRKLSKERLKNVTVREALNHPNWDMGAKVTIDSATMMNKGFEMIEAKWLFDVDPSQIDVVVHPESVVHSLVEFTDGSVKAQLGLPDMRVPIEVAISYPHRMDLLNSTGSRALNLAETGKLSFESPDTDKFPLLSLAYHAVQEGGLVPAIMNAANEMAVKAFLEEKIGFTDISRIVSEAVVNSAREYKAATVSAESIAEAHKEGTEIARNLIKQ